MCIIVIPELWSTFSMAMVALCTFELFGWKFTLDLDSLCILPWNVINEKIFAVIWLWYMFQLVISVSHGIYLLWGYCVKSKRVSILYHRARKAVSDKEITEVTNDIHMGKFFVLNQIGKNIDTQSFVDLLYELRKNKSK